MELTQEVAEFSRICFLRERQCEISPGHSWIVGQKPLLEVLNLNFHRHLIVLLLNEPHTSDGFPSSGVEAV